MITIINDADISNISIVEKYEQILADVTQFCKVRKEAGFDVYIEGYSEAQSNAFDFFSNANISLFWREIALLTISDQKYAIHMSQMIFRSYRTLSNSYYSGDEPIPEVFQHDAYLKFLSDSLVTALETLSPASMRSLVSLISHLSQEARHAFTLSLCYSSSFQQTTVRKVADHLDKDTLMDMLKHLYRIPYASSSSSRVVEESASLSCGPVYATVEALLSSLLGPGRPAPDSTVSCVVQKLLLHQPSTCQMACAVVRSLVDLQDPDQEEEDRPRRQGEGLVRGGLLLAAVWAEVAFVSRGDLAMQNYITAALLQVLRSVDVSLLTAALPEERDAEGAEGGGQSPPLLAVLSKGVATHLNSAERLTRVNGMRVAEALSKALGAGEGGVGAAHFDELRNFREDEYGNLLPVGPDCGGTSSAPKQQAKHASHDAKSSKKKVSAVSISGGVRDGDASSSGDSCSSVGSDDDDDDDDDDLESFYLDEVRGKRVVPPAPSSTLSLEDFTRAAVAEEGLKLSHYLRECLACKHTPHHHDHHDCCLPHKSVAMIAVLQFSDSTHPEGSYDKQKAALVSLIPASLWP
jgi:hypothetical protein